MKKTVENSEQLLTIAELIVEDYRFRRSYLSVMEKLFTEEKRKYESAYNFHLNKTAELSKKLGLRIVDFEGKTYDEGLPITPLNADEFNIADNLIVEQTIEPTVLTTDGNIIRYGKIILGKL